MCVNMSVCSFIDQVCRSGIMFYYRSLKRSRDCITETVFIWHLQCRPLDANQITQVFHMSHKSGPFLPSSLGHFCFIVIHRTRKAVECGCAKAPVQPAGVGRGRRRWTLVPASTRHCCAGASSTSGTCALGVWVVAATRPCQPRGAGSPTERPWSPLPRIGQNQRTRPTLTSPRKRYRGRDLGCRGTQCSLL